MADGEVRLNAGVALAPKYPQDRLGGGNDQGKAAVNGRRYQLEGKKAQGNGAYGGYGRGRGQCGGAIAQMALAAESGGNDEQEQGRGHQVHYPADSHAIVEELHVEEEIGDEPEGVVPREQQGEPDVLHHGAVEERFEGLGFDRGLRLVGCRARFIHTEAFPVVCRARWRAAAASV